MYFRSILYIVINVQIACEIDVRTLASTVFFLMLVFLIPQIIFKKYSFAGSSGTKNTGYPLTTINIAKRYLLVNDYKLRDHVPNLPELCKCEPRTWGLAWTTHPWCVWLQGDESVRSIPSVRSMLSRVLIVVNIFFSKTFGLKNWGLWLECLPLIGIGR